MKQYGSLRKPEIRKFIKSEIAKADRFIEVNDRFSIFYVKQFNRYVVVPNRTRSIASDAHGYGHGYGFKSVESARRLIDRFLFEESNFEAMSDYAGYSVYDL